MEFRKMVIITLYTAKSLQSCPTLCDPIDGSPPGSPVPGILQARTLEWVSISFSSAWKWKVKVKLLSHVRLFAAPWTVAHQASPSMGFSRHEYWSGVPLPSPEFRWGMSNTTEDDPMLGASLPWINQNMIRPRDLIASFRKYKGNAQRMSLIMS